jgi:hypothetical protein
VHGLGLNRKRNGLGLNRKQKGEKKMTGGVEEAHRDGTRLWAKTISPMGREKPGLAEQIHLVRAWNAELGRRKKKKTGRWNRIGANRRSFESEDRSRIERDREMEIGKNRAGSVMDRKRIG